MKCVLFVASANKGEYLYGMASVAPEDYADELPEVVTHFENLTTKFGNQSHRELIPNEDTLQLYINSEGYVRVHVTSSSTPSLDNHPLVLWLAEKIKEEAVKNGWKGFIETSTPLLFDRLFGEGEAEAIASMYYDQPNF